MNFITYPDGVQVLVDGGTLFYKAPADRAFSPAFDMDDPEFVARCIRLANPPDPATRRIWQDENGRWRGDRFFCSYLHVEDALDWWHFWSEHDKHNGGKP